MKNIDLFSDYTLLKKERKKGQLLYRWSRFELLNLENDLIKPSEHIFNKNICCSCKSTHAENGKKSSKGSCLVPCSNCTCGVRFIPPLK
ncbi:hypothetical protein D5R95_03945 [Methanosalsum natronophilum]|uniref:Uncharacterized protein n=1 Tax=Methanosalsum natronophilum TaxID=768733 RepID=A0A3R7YIS4_9EURY|nr:MAG: hypothetical protein D5R95_03945 [Methanosalsum natronophilum]